MNVVFYNNHKWLAGEECYDWRSNSQIIPGGSVVVGIIANGSSIIEEPSNNEAQHNNFTEVVEQATANLQ